LRTAELSWLRYVESATERSTWNNSMPSKSSCAASYVILNIVCILLFYIFLSDSISAPISMWFFKSITESWLWLHAQYFARKEPSYHIDEHHIP
jgi:hypothetical protein